MTITAVDQLDVVTACNGCGSERSRVVIDGRWGRIVRCEDCGLMYRTTMIGRYPAAFLGGTDHFRRQIEQKQELQLRDYARSFPLIESLTGRTGLSLLEIGSFTGRFLDLARQRGYTVLGVDPDPHLAAHAHEHYGVEVIPRFLRDAALPSDTFDVVVMFHVIEHFNTPREELCEIFRILKPGGILVTETPRYDTLWFRLLGEHERSVIPEHFFFFTRATLSGLCRAAGFDVVRLDAVGRTLTLDRIATNLCKMVGSVRYAAYVMRWAERWRLDRFSLYCNIHDMMRLYARKPSAVH